MNACEKTCVYVWRGNRNLQKVQPSAGFGFSGWLISWHGCHCRRVKYIFSGRGSISAGSRAYFVAGAALSQGHVHISWQVQHFRKVKCRIRGRRSTFARSTFAAGAQKSQLLSAKGVSEVNFRSWGLTLATFKYESSARSPLSQPGLKIATFKYESSTRSPLSQPGLKIATFKCKSST